MITGIRDGTVWWIVQASDGTVRGSGYDRDEAELWVNTEGRKNVEYEIYCVRTASGVSRTKKISTIKRSK